MVHPGLPQESADKFDIPAERFILPLSAAAYSRRSRDPQYADSDWGGSDGAAWRGGIAQLRQYISRTTGAFSSAWYRTRLGDLLGLRCLGRGVRQTRDRSSVECSSFLCEDKASPSGRLSSGGDA